MLRRGRSSLPLVGGICVGYRNHTAAAWTDFMFPPPALIGKNKQAFDWVGVRRRVVDHGDKTLRLSSLATASAAAVQERALRGLNPNCRGLQRAARTSARRGRGIGKSQNGSSRATRGSGFEVLTRQSSKDFKHI